MNQYNVTYHGFLATVSGVKPNRAFHTHTTTALTAEDAITQTRVACNNLHYKDPTNIPLFDTVVSVSPVLEKTVTHANKPGSGKSGLASINLAQAAAIPPIRPIPPIPQNPAPGMSVAIEDEDHTTIRGTIREVGPTHTFIQIDGRAAMLVVPNNAITRA